MTWESETKEKTSRLPLERLFLRGMAMRVSIASRGQKKYIIESFAQEQVQVKILMFLKIVSFFVVGATVSFIQWTQL